MPDETQLELPLTISPDVSVVRLPDGEVRLKPKPPMVEGSVMDAARTLGVSPTTLRRLISDGDIDAYKPGKRWWKVNMVSVYEWKRKRQKENGE